ncbi:xanthine dehydrogenase family protein molybdopterin-binding subunit [Methylovirgula sp. 4M-Z18]|uniref:xanthine dehydrogenase family protein molybdopterin-binding subunit n=1 Tax=Methylovirgula sp. 4M-Z18 TaxID=2293567 RepID=UPI000E2F1B59|nr:molybdopterin cofactor-binding domain-containing protein [Methylovirgula sp. 4M-Z18]RFB81109.1 xanthine dehydrogenase family protein molybdopterin-binding subunit [Methylovirgula sp. 4M-Z18]
MLRNPDPTFPAIGPSRRDLLRGSAALAGGLLIGIEFPLASAHADEPVPTRARFNAFIHIAPDDTVTFTLPAVEMGQGVYTSQTQCLAEELDVSLDKVIVAHAPPDQANYGSPVFVVQATGGSTTTMAWSGPLRKAAAGARAMLLQAAAVGWLTDAAGLTTRDGVITDPASGLSVRYGELADAAAELRPPSSVKLKDPSQFRLIGKPVHRIDTPDKAIGKTVYGIDVMRPGMKFATLMSSPVLAGKVGSVDQSKALTVAGVRQVVVLDDLVAVIADNTWAAMRGLDALAIEWAPGANDDLNQAQLWANIEKASEGAGAIAKKEGDAAARLKDGTLFEATYEFPFLAHAPMEMTNCTVHVHDGACEVWTGTQVPGFAQAGAAKVLGIDPAKVTINNHMIGGGFGRRLEVDGVIKAVRIAARVEGPVKVVWSREEDIRQQLYRPIYHDRLKARVENGKITAWHHRVTGGSIMARWLPPAFQDGVDVDAVDGAAEVPYTVGDMLVEYIRHESAVPVAFWRGVGPNGSIFSIESFMDLIARKTGTDPLAFRRGLLDKSPRALGVLNLVAEKASWGTSGPASPFGARRGRGFALMNAFGSYLAAIADVAVNDEGDVRVTRVVVAADVGNVINPDILVAQIQGGVVFGLSAVLHGKITFAGGRVEQSNFNDYRILRIDEMPQIEVHIVPSTENSGGIGEPGTVIVQPAVANAVFAATGVQLTRMPIDATLIAKAV